MTNLNLNDFNNYYSDETNINNIVFSEMHLRDVKKVA